MSATYTDDFDIAFPGPPGESQADILRRTGQFGVLPTDTDAQAMDKLNALGASARQELDSVRLDMRGVVGAGTVGEREAYVYRNGGTPSIASGDIWLRIEGGQVRMDVWKAVGDTGIDGNPVTVAGWQGYKTQAEMDNMSIGKSGVLPVPNQAGMANALDNIADLYKPKIAGFRATALSSTVPIRARLEWIARADSLHLSWGEFAIQLGGSISEIDTQSFDYDAPRPIMFIGDSKLEGTWGADAAAQLGREAVIVAKYSSGAKQPFRLGVRKLYCTASGDTIPASGGSVRVTSINGVAPSASASGDNPSSYDLFAPHGFLNTFAGDTIATHCSEAGTWSGRHGVMSVPNGGTPVYTFVPDDGLGATHVDPQSIFVPDNLARLKTHEVVIRLSQNYAFAGPGNPVFPHDINPRVLEDIQLVIDETVGQPVSVLALNPQKDFGMGPFGVATRYLNAQFAALWPNQSAKVVVGGVTYNGMEYVRWFGRDGSANDQADYDTGIMPRSVMASDAANEVHYNAKGNGLEKQFWLLWRQQRKRPSPITAATQFKMSAVRTQPALYPDEPVTWTSEPVSAAIEFGFEALIAGQVEQIKQAQASGAPYYAIRSEGAAAVGLGKFFTSNETGETRFYEVTSTSPFYVDRGRVSEEVTKATVGLGEYPDSPGSLPVSLAQQAALDTKVDEDVFNGTVAEIANNLVAQQASLDGKAESVTVNVRRFTLSAVVAAAVPDSVTAITIIDRANALFVPASAPEVLDPAQQNYSWLYTNGTSKRWKLAEQQIGFELFGAVGNGIADDAAPMQRCIDYVLSRAIPIDVTGGKNFRTTKSLNCTNNINTNPLVMRGASGRLTSLITGDLTEAYPVLDFTNAKRGGMRHIAVRTTATSLDTCSLLLAETDPSGINNFSLLFCSIYNSSLNAKASIIGLTADQVQLIYCEVIADGPSCQSAYRNDNNNLYGVSSKFRTIAAYSSDLTLVTATSTGFICQRGPGLDIRGFSSVTGIDCYLGCTGAVGSSTGMARFEGGGRKMQVRLLGCRSEDNTSAGATPCDCIYVVDAIYNSEITGTYGPKGGMFASPGTNYYGRFSGSAGGTGFFNQAGPQIGIDVSLGDGANSLGALSPAGLAGSKDWKLRGRIGTRSAVLAGFATIPGLIIEGLSSEDTVINQTRSSPTHSRMHALEASTPTNLRPAWNGPNNQISFPAYTGGSGQKAMGFIDVPLATLAHSGAATDVAYPTVVTTIHGILKSTSAANNSIVMQTGLNGGSGDRLTLLIPSAGAYEFEARVEMIRTGAGSVNALFSIQASPAHSADGVVSTGGQVLRVARRLSNAGVGSFVSSDSMRVGFAINNGASDPVESAYAKYQSS